MFMIDRTPEVCTRLLNELCDISILVLATFEYENGTPFPTPTYLLS